MIFRGESDLNFFSFEVTAFSEMNIVSAQSHGGRGLWRTRPLLETLETIDIPAARSGTQAVGQLGDHPPGPRIGALQRLFDQLPAGTRTMCAFTQDLPE